MSQSSINRPGYPSERLLAARDLRARVAALKNSSQSVLDAKRPDKPKPCPKTPLSQQPFDPEATLLTRQQVKLYYSSVVDGIFGICEVVTDNVQERLIEVTDDVDPQKAADKRNPYRHLLDDFQSGYKRMHWLILCIHRDVLESLMRGNLISREREDIKFLARTQDSTRLLALPSIYLPQIVNVEYLNEQRTPYPGRGLSWREWKATLEALTQYLDESEAGLNDAGSWVDQVDGSFRDKDTRKYRKNQKCRYLCDERQKDVLREFIDAAQRTYVNKGQTLEDVNPNDPALDIPFARVPQECGWGTSGIERATQHAAGGQYSNTLFGLFHCAVRELWGAERWEVVSRKLVDFTRPLDAPVAEYLCSELGQTYWYQGGLNPTLAGTMMMAGKTRSLMDPDYENLWHEAKSVVARLNYAHKNMAHYKKVQADARQIIEERKNGWIDKKWDEIEKTQSLLRADLDRSEERAYAYVLTCHIEAIDDWVRRNDEYQKAKAAENAAEASADA
jgi:hypothetical protein